MRSFLGPDIISLKDFERDEYLELFHVAEELALSAPPRAWPCSCPGSA